MLGRNAEPARRREISLGMRLAVADILTGDQNLRHWDAGGRHTRARQGPRSGGDNGPLVGGYGCEQVNRTRNGGDRRGIVDFDGIDERERRLMSRCVDELGDRVL